MQCDQILVINIGKNTVLLNDEHVAAHFQYGVHLDGGKLFDLGALPFDYGSHGVGGVSY